METPKYTEPLINLNKKVYLMGMNPVQAAVVLVAVLLTLLVNFIISILVLVGAVFLFKKAHSENANGNPDFIKGWLNFLRGPKVIEDNNGVLENLIWENNEN
jgi:uncharacterized protein involved in cysteine biosynthesis